MALPAPSMLGRISHFWGLDRAVVVTLVNRGWSFLAAPVTLLLIARFLSPQEQGFYYTFSNVLALQAFLELGLAYVFVQFASHETARLERRPDGFLHGDPNVKSRLGSLLRMGVRWYAAAGALVIGILIPAGIAFFAHRQGDALGVTWRIPWIIVVVASVVALLLLPFQAILEGCGFVADIAGMRLRVTIIGNAVMWTALAAGLKLYASAAMHTLAVAATAIWIWRAKGRFLSDLLSSPVPEAGISWRHEIWPMQWKIALSWISGYLTFQLFNPVLFAYHGPVAAGQMGMSLSLGGSLTAVGLAWMMPKAPTFGTLAATRAWAELDRLFVRSLWQSTAAMVIAGGGLWIAALYLSAVDHPWSSRLLPPHLLALIIATTILYHIIFSETIYLRAHKEEPLAIVAVLLAVVSAAVTFVAGRRYGAAGMVWAYFGLTAGISIEVFTFMFLKKRREWHAVPAAA